MTIQERNKMNLVKNISHPLSIRNRFYVPWLKRPDLRSPFLFANNKGLTLNSSLKSLLSSAILRLISSSSLSTGSGGYFLLVLGDLARSGTLWGSVVYKREGELGALEIDAFPLWRLMVSFFWKDGEKRQGYGSNSKGCLSPSLMASIGCPEFTCLKERTSSFKLASDLHKHTMAHVYTHTQIK